MALKAFRAIKTKARSAVMKTLHLEELTADNIRDLSSVGLLGIFVSDSQSGWIPCDGRIISYASDSTPGFIQTAYKELVLKLKEEANGDTSHPYYVANEFQAKVPNKNEFDSFPLGIPLPSMWDPSEDLPEGFMRLEGQALDTTTYADLFEKLGYTHGGSGSTFNLPDLRGAVLRGSGTGSINGRNKEGPAVGDFQEDQMQRIEGSVGSRFGSLSSATESGALGYETSGEHARDSAGGGDGVNITLNSADSPDARTSDTTEGETRVYAAGTQYIMRVTQSPKIGEYWMVKY